MTRDEAIKIELNGCPVGRDHPKYAEAAATIDRYARLGMLKLVEKPSIKDRARGAILELDVDRRRSSNEIIGALEAAGLKIVEA